MAEAAAQSSLVEEDEARAHCYALISRLFYAPVDDALLHQLSRAGLDVDAASVTGNTADPSEAPSAGSFAQAFLALQSAARSGDLEGLRQQYDDMFIAAGKALVTPYTSGYALPSAPDRHLVALREQLAAWRLARRDSVFEVEDHVSAICDAMRWLIESARSLEEQRAFFDDYVYTGVGPFCAAVADTATTPFYRSAAALARAFLDVEKESFALHAAE